MLKRGKLMFLVVLFLFFIVNSVNADNHTVEDIGDDSIELAYDWLFDQMNSSDWDRKPDEIALSILALGGEGFDVSKGIEKLKELKSGNSWGNGDIRDTSLAVLALYKAGENVSAEIDWLNDQHRKALGDGEWHIQLDSSFGASTCQLEHEGNSYFFKVNDSDVTQTGDNARCTNPSNWIDFLVCIKGDDKVDIIERIDVECAPETSSSVIFETEGNQFFIIDEGSPLNIENGCFQWQNECNCDRSGFAGWVLGEVGEESFVKPYMISNCAGPRGYSFLYTMTSDPFYSNWLEANQDFDGGGSWGNQNLKTTYLVLLGLKKVGELNGKFIDDAENFIRVFQNKKDGSWNQNIEDTAFILYILYSGDFNKVVPPIINGGGDVCGDGLVGDFEDCEENSDCSVGERCSLTCECVSRNETSTTCGDGEVNRFNEDCDGSDLDSQSCKTLDYSSGNLFCDDNCKFDTASCIPKPITCSKENEEFNPVTGQCEEKTSLLKWTIIGLFILLGLAIIYYVYKKYLKGKGGKGRKPFSHSPKSHYKMTRHHVPVRRPSTRRPGSGRRESRIEKELEESIKRAKNILHKK